MGKTVDEIAELRDFALKMGATTAFSASEAADALNYMALAGYDVDTSMKMLPNVLNLAAAGSMDLAAASDMITDSQTALGLTIEETNELVDKMASAASKSNTSVSQLGDAILTVGGTAKNLKGGTTELSTVLGLLADNGIKGSEAGTKLRNIMMALNPTTKDAIAAFDALGVQTYDSSGELRSMEDIFGDLSRAMAGMTDQERTQIISDIFNKQDIAAVNALLSTGTERWEELSGAIDNSSGAAQKMADTQLDNLAGDIKLFESALESAKISISDQLTPTLREFVQFGTDAIGRLTEAFNEGGVDGAISVFGDILSDGIEMISKYLPVIFDAGGKVLNAVIDGIVDNLPTITAAASDILQTLISALIEAAPQLLTGLIAMIPIIIDGITQLLPAVIEFIPEIIAIIVDALIANAPALGKAAIQLVVALCEGLGNALGQIYTASTKLLEPLTEAMLNTIGAAAQWGSDLIDNFIGGVKQKWENLKNTISNVAQTVKDFLGFSEPKKGPLSNFHTYAPDMMDLFAKGIRDNEKVVTDQIEKSFNFDVGTIDYDTSASGRMQSAFTSMAASMSNDAKITVQSVLDGRIIGENTYNYIQRKERAVGA